MSLWAALAISLCQADPNQPRPAAELVPESCDVLVSIPDAPALRRKLRKEPYKAIMADVAAAMDWPIDPSRILGLLGGEIALAVPDVTKDATLIIVDTGVKDNSYANWLTRLLQDPWKRTEEDWKDDGKVVVLTSKSSTWYTHSRGRYFLLSTDAAALKGLIHNMAAKPEACLATNPQFRTAAERLKDSDVLSYANWAHIKDQLSYKVPADWVAMGAVFNAESIDLRMSACGKDLACYFTNAALDRPACIPAEANAVTIAYPVADRWRDVPGLESLSRCELPLVLMDFEMVKCREKCSDPIWDSEAFKAMQEYCPQKGCAFDFRTSKGVEALLLLPGQKAAEAKKEGQTVFYERSAQTLTALAPLSKHVVGALTCLETTADGLSGRIVIRLKSR